MMGMAAIKEMIVPTVNALAPKFSANKESVTRQAEKVTCIKIVSKKIRDSFKVLTAQRGRAKRGRGKTFVGQEALGFDRLRVRPPDRS